MVRVGYFLEDKAHEKLVKAIVTRIAEEEGIPRQALRHDPRAVRGGKAIGEYRKFLKDMWNATSPPFDILVVAVDGNCKGYNDRALQLRKIAERARYKWCDHIVLAIPDPHIERWYMISPPALQAAVGAKYPITVPSYKCSRKYYRRILHQYISKESRSTFLGGPEYGEAIIQLMDDLYQPALQDTGLKHFLDDLRRIFRTMAARR